MAVSIENMRKCLKGFHLKQLFIEELGWDYYSGHLQVPVDETEHELTGIAQKRGMAVFICDSVHDEGIPPYPVRLKIERTIAKSVREHLIIYMNSGKTRLVWQWVRREIGKPVACREHAYRKGQPGDSLIEKLRVLAFSLEEEDSLTIFDVTSKARAAFDVERVTRQFYELFKTEHKTLLRSIKGILDEEHKRWYVSVILNRLMFVYFIQRRGFLGDEDRDYLRVRLEETKQRGKDLYYKDFLCPLFFQGFARRKNERSAQISRMLGQVPYLNGGIFLQHQVERVYDGEIQIPDTAFERLFDFFDGYQWHLDDRPLRADNEINPDVLGYIFEKYINAIQPGEQKSKGAYYTKEDITGYISRSAIIPFLFNETQQKCRIPFEAEPSVWRLLQLDPNRYVSGSLRKGVELDLPRSIQEGMDNVTKRTNWNEVAPEEFGLPTEIWREVIERRDHYYGIREKISSGGISDISDLITHNLDIQQFAQDVIENCDRPELVLAFWQVLENISVLDPACGSGAFLFAALNVLEPIYEACLNRMEVFVEESEQANGNAQVEELSDFKEILRSAGSHLNTRYFIFKSVIVNNIYGVDIMEEATEIAKLRLFLKLVSQVDRAENLEPLPDIDFNIRTGNTLVGFSTKQEVQDSIRKVGFNQQRLPLPEHDNAMKQIEEKAQDVDRSFQKFHEIQIEEKLGYRDMIEPKEELSQRLAELENELNGYLAGEYGVKADQKSSYRNWLSSHKPFHWFVEFYGILKRGGFDVVIGNPPYVEYKDIRNDYELINYSTKSCKNLFAYFLERSTSLGHEGSRVGMIVPLSAFSTDRMIPLIDCLKDRSSEIHIANFGWRPGKLFEGVNLPLSIVFQTLGDSPPEIRTTRYLHWDSKARAQLFAKIRYSTAEDETLPGSIPKLGSSEAVSILHKLRSKGRNLGNLFGKKSGNKLFYRRGGLYWKVFVDSETGSSEEKIINLKAGIDRYAIISVLSSSLWFWYFTITSDNRHLGNRDIDTFPFDPNEMDPSLYKRIRELGREYVDDLKSNANERVRVYKGKKAVNCIIFEVKKSKSVIDRIDKMLSRYYDFSEEELDFIINYDIKYRMGISE